MKIAINQNLCIGCALCTSLAEEVFEMKGDKAQPVKGTDLTNKKNYKKAKEAEQSCPVGAIKVFG